MKTIQAKKLKTKISKGGLKQSKAKLPQYKVRNKLLVQGKRNSFLSHISMNHPCRKSKNGDSPSKERSVAQYSLKRRKKKLVAGEKGSQHSMDLSLESSNDSAEARPPTGSDDQSSNQRNIRSPVIVEALSESLSSLSIPKVLKQCKQRKVEKNLSDNTQLHICGMGSEDDEACIVVADLFNPNSNAGDTENNEITVSSLRNNHKPRRNKKQSQELSPSKCKQSSTCSGLDSKSSEKCSRQYSAEIDGNSSVLEEETLNKNDVVVDQYPVRFYCLKNKVVALMSERARFCFTGKLVVKVIYGAIEAYGCVIRAENGPVEIYSPRGYSNVSIVASEKFTESCELDIWTPLFSEGVDRNRRNKLVVEIEQIQPGTAVVLLSNLENKLTRFLHTFYPFRLFPRIKHTPHFSWTHLKRAETILQSNLYIGNYACKELIIDPRIAQEVAEKILIRWRAREWSCALIVGGKSVGKSTTSRYLINSLLPESKMVVLLDVDPGQTECTPSGCISYSLIEQPLMGPNFTHLKIPIFQLYIGDVNVSRCITRYIEGVKMLVDKLLSCPILSRLPIIVNTMGFAQGIGWDIVLFTIKLIRPSFVVQIMSGKPKNNYIGYLSKQVVNKQQTQWTTWCTNVVNWSEPCDHELFVVRSHAEGKSGPGCDNWNMEPYQQRELVMVSYLSEIVQNPASFETRYDTLSLSINETIPYVTSFASLFISVPQTSVPSTHVLNVINGNIVALCGIDVNYSGLQESEVRRGPRVLNRLPLCACYGFGIIRGIDVEREEIFINTALPLHIMQCVNCLAGCIPVPVTLLQLNQYKNVPYVGGNNVLPMSREHRRGYFRMRYHKGQNNA